MDANSLADYFRSQVRDDVEPYLWSDEEVLTYMNEAQRMFVRLTNGIFDVSSAACTVTVTSGQKFATLNSAVLHIRKAYYITPVTGFRRELKIINLGNTSTLNTWDYGVYKNASIQDIPGIVDYMVVGEERGKVRWINTPTENATVELAIARLPLTTLSTSQLTLEVSEEHHVSLIEWMKHLAYNKQDGDAYDPKTSRTSEEKFRIYCEQVFKEWERYRHTHRTVAYGGI